MKQAKYFVMGFLVATLMFSTMTFGAGIKRSIEVALNSVNISVEGVMKGQIGENFKLPNGDSAPFSIVYNGTTYLPIRKVSELVGKDITWDGNTSTIDLKTPTQKTDQGVVTAANSRSNPAKIGNVVRLNRESFSSGKSVVDLNVVDFVRGQAAWEMIKAENQFNDAPKAGFEYILVKFNAKVISSDNDNPVDISKFWFEAVRKDGTVYSDLSFAVIPDPIDTDLYQGSSKQGFVMFQVEQGDEPLIRAKETYNTYKWFSLTK